MSCKCCLKSGVDLSKSDSLCIRCYTIKTKLGICVDFTAVTKYVNSLLGFDIDLAYNIVDRNGRIFIEVKSEELLKFSGIFKSVFKSVRIVNFGGKVLDNRISIPLSISYTLIEGGSNGNSLIYCNYHFNKGVWEFRKL